MTMQRYCLILAAGLLLGQTAPLTAEVTPRQSVDRRLPVVDTQSVMPGYEIDKPLTDQPGVPSKGRSLVLGRQTGLCLLCHQGPFPEAPFQGGLAPDLGQSAARLTAGQLRAHLVEPQRFNPATVMPSYLQSEGLTNVAPQYRGQSILVAQDIEDIVAFLLTLKP